MVLSRDYFLKALRRALWGNTFEEEINKDLFFHVHRGHYARENQAYAWSMWKSITSGMI